MTDDQRWARTIHNRANEADIQAIVTAINECRTNRAAVTIACAQILGQCIAPATTDAAEIHAGIVNLIDAYSMHIAVEITP